MRNNISIFETTVDIGSVTFRRSYEMHTGLFFYLGLNRPKREVDHSPMSGAELSNLCSFTSIPSMYFGDVMVTCW